MTSSDPTTPLATDVLDAMTFRCVGPPRGGRVVAVAGDPDEPAVFYFGAAAGGVWKTDDAGRTWRNLTDDHLLTAAIGALTVSDADPNVIWVGTGEATIRNDVSHGDGVYRSTDAGRTWEHRGLEDTRHISEIVVDPRDPDRALVAALGHAFGPNQARGVFRTVDGGESWQRVLFVSDTAGAADLTIDPGQPDTVYASLWEASRNPWMLSSGGPDSGIWRSTDGGGEWEDLTARPGLPGGLLGKIGLSASPARAGRVWAAIESKEAPGLYRSDDHGETWELVCAKPEMRVRPWYYQHVFADPLDPETVYVNNADLWRSSDGGRTFIRVGTPHADNHDLWIDPADNRRMIQSNDGGANISFNGGETWTTVYNQLTAQLYTVTTDDREPFYRLYATQQDNTSLSVPSSTNDDVITWADCEPTGTGESGFVAVDPRDPDIVYVGAVGSSPGGAGALQRCNRRTGQIQLVNVWPENHYGIGVGDLRHRFGWTYPILFSPHDPAVLYTGGNRVFRSTDDGHSWQPISPDLTRNDPDTLGPSGGPITLDTSGAEHYGTITTLRESPLEAGVLWVGSDDGRVHRSDDGGDTWVEVTPPALGEWSWIRTVEPSPHDADTVYLAATRYRLDDTAPYLFRSTDRGRTWAAVVGERDGALPAETIVRVVRTDPEVAGVLYLGSETGLFVTTDDGITWYRWDADLPVVPVYDIEVKGDDLVLATHGRGFWILDDLGPLRQLGQVESDRPAHLFTPAAAWRILPPLTGGWAATQGRGYGVGISKEVVFDAATGADGRVARAPLGAGSSAPLGATVTYHLDPAALDGGALDPGDGPVVSLTIVTASGDPIRTFTPAPPDPDGRTEEDAAADPGPWLPVEPGLNSFVWDLRYPGIERLAGSRLGEDQCRGPLVLPGRYGARLIVGEGNEAEIVGEEWFEVRNDPRVEVEPDHLVEQLEVLLTVRDTLSAAHRATGRIRSLAEQVERWRDRLDAIDHGPDLDPVRALADDVAIELADIEDQLVRAEEHRDAQRLDFPARLTEKLGSTVPLVASADARPTEAAREVVELHCGQIAEQLDLLDQVVAGDLAELNRLIAAAELPAIG